MAESCGIGGFQEAKRQIHTCMVFFVGRGAGALVKSVTQYLPKVNKKNGSCY